MRRKIFFIFIFAFSILLFGNAKVNADMWFVGTEGYNDGSLEKSHYAPKVISASSGDDIQIASANKGDVIGGYVSLGGGRAGEVNSGNGIIKLTNNTTKANYSTDGVIVGDTIKIRFYVIDDDQSVSFKNQDGQTSLQSYSANEEYYNISGGQQVVGGRVYHNRFELSINFKKASNSQVDVEIPVPLDNNKFKYTVHVIVPKVIDMATIIRDQWQNRGYIKDSNGRKLNIESGTHKFGTSGSINSRAESFIDSYELDNDVSTLKDKTGKELEKTPNFSKYTHTYNKGNRYDKMQQAQVGFNFKAKEEQVVYSCGTTRIYEW